MIAANHPSLGATRVTEGGSRSLPVFEHIVMPSQPSPIRSIATPAPSPAAPVVPVSQPVVYSSNSSAASETSSASSSSVAASPNELPIQVSSIVDPVTGVIYAGYLTQDAQALYNSGSLLTGGNVLTPQGSALAAQGDLIQGTPAPSAAQIEQAQPGMSATSTGFFSSVEAWLSSETLFTGYPNGLVAAGVVIAAAWVFGGKKGRRR